MMINSRKEFEKWITSSPYEKEIERYPEDDIFPGQYESYEVQMAWEAWEEAIRLFTEDSAERHRTLCKRP